ncbi:MAG: glycoside hydrolase family 127 protein [Armatimonadetes bacterium]|nr:glycoside hydrolase family 127 protein [Armatimonadota bacterium]MDW8122216.1 glycoside hydrolase family 127 protein [Armatimonadota bacterium]
MKEPLRGKVSRRVFLKSVAVGLIGGQRGIMGNFEANREAFLTDVRGCPFVAFLPLSLTQVRLLDGFWHQKLVLLQEVTIPTQYERLRETGRLDNFLYAAGKLDHTTGLQWLAPDSDVYKWLEALSWSLTFDPRPSLVALADEVIGLIAGAQDSNGYLHTLFNREKKKERWTNLRDLHELYCAGHLMQAAVAHRRVTGSDALLNVAVRLADHINQTFGPNGKPEPDGHPEVEMALVELFRETKKPEYLSLAQFFLDQRGKGLLGGFPNIQDHLPFRQLREMTGHAVRALYLNCGAADIYGHTGEKALMDALLHMWRNMTERRMYVTGGLGARHEGETFGRDYELPSQTAYAETCAAVAGILWAWRMMLLTGSPSYADVLETILYNGALSGIGLDGQSYFYVNPLSDRGGHRRQPFYPCACCPPNIARLIPMVPGMLYGVSDNTIWVHFFAASQTTVSMPTGDITILQETNYPWSGDIQFRLELEQPTSFTFKIRIPAWTPSAQIFVNDHPSLSPRPGEYAQITREWRSGDSVMLSLEMKPQLLASHPWAESISGKVSLRRGPIIYCWEQVDNPGADVWSIYLSPDTPLQEQKGDGILSGIVLLKGQGWALPKGNHQPLYQPAGSLRSHLRPVSVTAVPYFAWANRTAGPMTVWLPLKP